MIQITTLIFKLKFSKITKNYIDVKVEEPTPPQSPVIALKF